MATNTDVVATFVYGALALILGQCSAPDFVGVLLVSMAEVVLMVGNFTPLTVPGSPELPEEFEEEDPYELLGATAAVPRSKKEDNRREASSGLIASALDFIKTEPMAQVASAILSNMKVRKAFIHSLADPTYGPLLVRPFVQMLCFALAGTEAFFETDPQDPFGYEADVVVATFLEVTMDLDNLKLGEKPFVFYDLLDGLRESVGEESSTKRSLLTDEAKAAYAEIFEFYEMAGFPELREGLDTVVSSSRDYVFNNDLEHAKFPAVSLVHGLLRMCASDMNLAKALLEAAGESNAVVSAIADHFCSTYGIVGKEETEGTIKVTIEMMLEKWEDRATLFATMKNGYYKLAGKKFPVNFRGYEELVDGVKTGQIGMETILAFLHEADFDHMLLQRIAEFDIHAYARLKYAYMPMFYFMRDYLEENAHKLAKPIKK